jgi:AraC-like DNA-binding protein
MRLLAESDAILEAVAARVGYGDAFSFSKAFKRATGLAPGEFRRRDATERHFPWRIGAHEAIG